MKDKLYELIEVCQHFVSCVLIRQSSSIEVIHFMRPQPSTVTKKKHKSKLTFIQLLWHLPAL